MGPVRGSLCFAMILGACGFEHGKLRTSSTTDDGGTDDGAIDGPPDVPRGCFGAIVPVCPGAEPMAPKVLSGTINTSSHPDCRPTGTALDACVIAGTTITIESGNDVIGVGPKPLVLLATQTITIAGTLDVASRRAGATGAGAGTGTCDLGEPPITRGGGTGGSYGFRGGAGGAGGGPTALASAPITTWTTLRGGCTGSNGAGGDLGTGGAGGGAVALIAAGINVTATGKINASGAGGSVGQDSPVTGGGGGGSGGTIVLDTATLTVLGTVFAHGGGGGGASGGSSDATDHGDDPSSIITAALGGNGAGGGGRGGDGSLGGAGQPGANGNNTTNTGGGGGGGGAGVIKTSAPSVSTANISPAPS